jgi:hypothetical protein
MKVKSGKRAFWHKVAVIVSMSGTIICALVASNAQEFVLYVGATHMTVWSTWAVGNVIIPRLLIRK